jgi:hypothetical protein
VADTVPPPAIARLQPEMEYDRSRKPGAGCRCDHSSEKKSLASRIDCGIVAIAGTQRGERRSRVLIQTDFQRSPKRTAQPGNRPILGRLMFPWNLIVSATTSSGGGSAF